MKTYDIYKTYGLYSNEETNDFINNLKSDYEEVMTETELKEDMADLISQYFEDELSNIRYANKGLFNIRTYAITGVLGLWDGSHEIQPHYCSCLIDAIYKCINDMDDFKIYEDSYGNLKIDAYHHDGCNRFTIKVLAPGSRDAKYRMRCVHLRREVYGC